MSKKLTIVCSKDELIKVRQFTSDALDEESVPDLQAHKLVLAVDEVCANLIIHANNCDPINKIEFNIEFRPTQIMFTFKDKGVGFDINEYECPSMDKLVSTRRQGGLGLMLVKRIMDKIEFSTEKNHNICRLIKTYPL
ncbi:MAG: ATP-binding protein [Ekhidna sp.]|nr:ATP-binding protein [Ekhidna sp.]MBC6410678.1 ATP-binding protein [Ekhidna sp.]